MYFWFGSKIENFLFNGYNITELWGLISTCLGLLALAIIFEAMKFLQVRLNQITKNSNKEVPSPVPNTDSSSLLSRKSEKSIATASSLQW